MIFYMKIQINIFKMIYQIGEQPCHQNPKDK